MRALVTGATGFIGGLLVERLAGRGVDVRCLVRDRARAAKLGRAGHELHEGDVLSPETLRGAGRDIDVAYYLIHSMGRGAGGDFAEREREAARAFATMAKDEGVGRVVYLGGLGDEPGSKHLQSRHETGVLLGRHGPPLTYFRASMVVGAGSESYRMLHDLVHRLPLMIAPAWLATPTQPIAADDAVEYLASAPTVPESAGREVEIGGADVLSYAEMLDAMARAIGKRPAPKVSVPWLSPKLSSLWIGLVTPVDAGLARPLIESLSTETVVRDPSGAALFPIEPIGIEEMLARALAEDGERPALSAR